MATFGNTNVSTDSGQIAESDVIVGGKATLNESAAVSKLTCNVRGWGSGEKGRAAIYNSDRDYLNQTVEKTGPFTDNSWVDLEFSSLVYLEPGDYYLVFWTNSEITINAEFVSGSDNLYDSSLGGNNYSNWPQSLEGTSSFLPSFYATYTTPTPSLNNITSIKGATNINL